MRWLKAFIRAVQKILVAVFLAHLVYLLALKWIYPPITVTQLASVVSGHGLKRDQVRHDQVSPHAFLAVIAAEDQLFPDHNGFDLKSIENAIAYNKKKPGRVRGASTISQQTAKNVFLWQGRSWVRKGLEVYCTFMIELVWGKQRILDVYMNVAEMGPGVFGIEAAAQHYYRKTAKDLTRVEAARIAAALPNPKKYRVNPASEYVVNRSSWILNQMKNLAADPDIKLVISAATAGK